MKTADVSGNDVWNVLQICV